MAPRHWHILPATAPGRWSVGFILVMPILFVAGTLFAGTLYGSVPAGDTIQADIVARPALALTMLAGIAAGIAAFVTGLLAIIGRKDHALLVYAATAGGALLILFLTGELLFPH